MCFNRCSQCSISRLLNQTRRQLWNTVWTARQWFQIIPGDRFVQCWQAEVEVREVVKLSRSCLDGVVPSLSAELTLATGSFAISLVEARYFAKCLVHLINCNLTWIEFSDLHINNIPPQTLRFCPLCWGGKNNVHIFRTKSSNFLHHV